jgi:hypothetical protein
LTHIDMRVGDNQTLEARIAAPGGKADGSTWMDTRDLAVSVGDNLFQVKGSLDTAPIAADRDDVTAECLEALLTASSRVSRAVVVQSNVGIVAFVVPAGISDKPLKLRGRRSEPRSVLQAIEQDAVGKIDDALAARGAPTIAEVRLIEDPGPAGWTPDGEVRATFREMLAGAAELPQVVASS